VDISSLISSFSNGTFTVTRTARGSISRGVIAAGTQTSVTITAAWHPATGKDLLRLPEGRRTVETRVLYTITQMYVGGQGADYEADTVSIGGASWECQQVETWQDTSSSRIGYRCIVQAV
jgi:hypothetical protein